MNVSRLILEINALHHCDLGLSYLDSHPHFWPTDSAIVGRGTLRGRLVLQPRVLQGATFG